MEESEKNKWTIWSIDCLGNPDDGWEFNDRSAQCWFEFQIDDDEKEDGIIRKMFERIESETGLDFQKALDDGKIYCDWEDENNLYIYKSGIDLPLYQIEKGGKS